MSDIAEQPAVGQQAASADPIIGRIISVPTKQSPSFDVLHARLAHSTPSLKPGTWVYVAVLDGDLERRILCRVINSWEHNPHEDAQSSLVNEVLPFGTDYAEEGESMVIYRVAELEPMEEAVFTVDDEGGSSIREILDVSTLPRAGASVHLADGSLIVAALGFESSEADGLHVGTIRGTNVPAIIKRNAVQRHIFIGGGIGSGKSYTRGVLAEELHMQGVPQVNIDVNGEMVAATAELGGMNLVPGQHGFTLPLSSLTSSDVLDAIPGLNKSTNIATLISYAHEDLLKELTLASGQHFGVSSLVERIDRVATILGMTQGGTLGPAKQRAGSLVRVPYIGEPFAWEEHLKPGAIINIDCRGLLVSDLRLIVASIARDLQRLARSGRRMFVAFSIDEFHLVAPNDDSSVTTQVLREIARIGRHYRIGLILTTQSPQDVDRSILKRLLTRFLHSIEPDQLDALRGVFSDASESLIKSLPKLPQGTCIVTGAFETIRHATVVDVRSRRTTHGGATPDIWSEFSQMGWTGKRPLSTDVRREEPHDDE